MDIKYLLFLQGLRENAPAWINGALFGISEIAAGVIPLLAMALVYWCFSKKAGVFMLFSYNLGNGMNALLKDSACIHRPWVRDSRVTLAKEVASSATGYSFPSGHSTAAATFYGSLAKVLKKHSAWWVLPCAFLIVLTGFARNWVGAHTPQDVACGIITGLLMVVLSGFIVQRIEKNPDRDWIVTLAVLLCSIAALTFIILKSYPLDADENGVLFADPYEMKIDAFKNIGGLIGFVIGWYIERHYIKFEIETSWQKKILRFAIGGIILALIFMPFRGLLKNILGLHWGNFIGCGLSMFFMAAGVPALFKLKFLK